MIFQFISLCKIIELKNKINNKLPIIVKIAPDLNNEELKDIAEVAMRKDVNFFFI